MSFNLFGNTGATAGSSTQGSSTPGSLFGNTNAPPAQPSGGLFGGAAPAAPAAAGGGLFGSAFGGANNNNSTNAATGSTPAAAPTGGLFGNTNNNAAAPSGGLFGGAPASSTPAAGGGLFGGGAASTTPAAPTGGLFGGGAANAAGSTPSTGAAPAPPAGGLFAGFGQPKPADQNAPKPATSSFFAQPSTNTSTTSTTPAAPSLFGTTPASTSTSTTAAPASTPAAAPAPAAGGGLFGGGLFGKKPDAPAANATAAPAAGATGTTPAPSLFNLGGASSSTTPATTAGASTTAPAAPAAPSLFGTASSTAPKPEEKKDGAAPAAPPLNLFGAANANKDAADKSKPAAPASTTGATSTTSTQVSVPPPSMLRGKTIEEIVNKWTGELETHVKDFGKFAAEVSVWDRALIESGNNLSALYATLLAAEREQNDVDQSLEHIEQQQRDLAATLDAYEKVTDEILGSQAPSQGSAAGTGGLRALDTGPADTERDRNYMLATELHGHLDDLSASLAQMIESVNALAPSSAGALSASTTADSALSATQNGSAPGSDDPLTQIAQVLANHLESLQWIDGAVKEVEAKVVDVERRVRSAAGDGAASPRLSGGPGSVGPGGGIRGVGGIGADFGVRFGSGR